MANLLKNKNISKTPFRQKVLAIFAKHENAIPLSIVEKELKEYNRITLYRTIKVFLEKGILHKITISGEEPNYAICQEECSTAAHQHQHIHFKCKECATISCVEIDTFPNITLPKHKIEQLEIQAVGICQNCNV
jgi:Fur family ferric uptake transcriptional regulator